VSSATSSRTAPRSEPDRIASACRTPRSRWSWSTANRWASSGFVEDGDRIAVYPMFEALDVTPVLRLRERPLRNPRFALDVQLGALTQVPAVVRIRCPVSHDWADGELARPGGCRSTRAAHAGFASSCSVRVVTCPRPTSVRRRFSPAGPALKRYVSGSTCGTPSTRYRAMLLTATACFGDGRPKATVGEALPPRDPPLLRRLHTVYHPAGHISWRGQSRGKDGRAARRTCGP
jgi:hypothetical protein